MAGGGGVVAENGVLHHGLFRAYRFHEVPHMWREIVVRRTAVSDRLGDELFAGRRIMGVPPVFLVSSAHGRREALVVVAGRGVYPTLWDIREIVLADFEQAFGSHESRHLGGLGAERKAHVHGNLSVF